LQQSGKAYMSRTTNKFDLGACGFFLEDRVALLDMTK